MQRGERRTSSETRNKSSSRPFRALPSIGKNPGRCPWAGARRRFQCRELIIAGVHAEAKLQWLFNPKTSIDRVRPTDVLKSPTISRGTFSKKRGNWLTEVFGFNELRRQDTSRLRKNGFSAENCSAKMSLLLLWHAFSPPEPTFSQPASIPSTTGRNRPFKKRTTAAGIDYWCPSRVNR
jgi:hypothetical protein